MKYTVSIMPDIDGEQVRIWVDFAFDNLSLPERLEATADIVRRIEGDAPAAESRGAGNVIVAESYAAWRKEGWNAALVSLIEYLKSPVPPVADERLEQANAAAEQRGAEKRQAQIVEWLRKDELHRDLRRDNVHRGFADDIERGEHLRGDDD